MALKVGDRIKQLTNSTGTGDISFVSTPAAFAAFSSVLSSGDITYYAITENDKYEVGIGTYGDSNMVRTTVLGSSNNNNHINLGGSGVVFITYPSDRSVFRNLDGQVVVGPSGLYFNNGTLVKDAKIGELTDVGSNGTPSSTYILSFDHTDQSLLIGDSTGPSNSKNILIGDGAASGITSGSENVVLGVNALTATNAGIQNVSIGTQAGPYETDYSSAIVGGVSVGYQAGSRMRSYSTAIGYKAGITAYELNFVAIGSNAGYKIGSYSVSIGSDSGYDFDEDYYVAIGYKAGYEAAGESSIWIGNSAGQSASASTKSIGIGYQAGKNSSANDSIYIGTNAGRSNSDNDYLYIGNGQPSSNGTLIKGDMQNKMLAIGAADVTLEDTLYVGIPSATKKGLVIKSAAAQSALLTDWQTSAGASVAALSNSGVLTTNAVHASGNGLKLADITPASTAATLYNVGSALYWNGLAIETSATDVSYVSGVATYASGQAIENEADIATNATNIIATSGIANYASGQVLSLANASGIATYASGVLNGGTPTFDDMYVGEYIYHNGDTNTYIRFRGDQLDFVAGNITMLTLDEASNDKVIINNGKNNVDFQVEGDGDDNLIRTDAANDLVGIGTDEPAYKLDIFGHNALVRSSGLIVGNSGIVLANSTPNVTSNTLYNTGGSLYFNGSEIGGVDTYTSGVATYASGQAIANEGDIVAVSGIANYASGQAIANESDIVAVSGIANYASGQAIENESDILALLDASGTATSLVSTSGIAAYASGNTANISFGSNAEGDILYHNGTNFVRLAKGTDDYILKMNGNVPNWEEDAGGGGDVTTAQLNYVSGIAVYSSGQAIENEGDIVAVSGIANYASGNSITNATNIVATSGIANYASGQAIENEGNITALLDASGTATALISTSGIATYASGNTANIAFGSNAEGDILYHNGTSFVRLAKGSDDYVLKMNGNVPNWEESTAGDVTTAQLNYVSGIAVYSSGQAIANESDIVAVSGIAHYASGQSESLNNVSGVATSLISSSGIATYASGNSLTNASNIIATSGIANYASGQVLSLNNVSGVARSLVATSGIAIYASGQATSFNTVSGVATSLIATSGIAVYSSGQAIANESDIVATSGIAAYASGQSTSLNNVSGVATSLVATSGIATYASGNTANIAFGSNAEGDMLYHNGTSFTRLAKGTNNHVLTMDGNVPNWEAAGGGSPGGSDTQVQFNDGSSFGGDSDLVWNKTTNVLTINGTLMASLKAFVIDHPTKEGMRLQYGSLEGPENGVYVRGEIEGNNTIELPDYWIGLVDENSITVQLTPQHHAQPNLFVDRIEDNKVYLRSDKRVNAYYIVHATRKDVDPLEVEWPK